MIMGWLDVVRYKLGGTIATAVIKPIATVKAIISPKITFEEVRQEFLYPEEKKEILKATAKAVIGYAAAMTGVAAVSKLGVLGAAKLLIPTTLKGKAVAAVAVPFGVAYAIKKPEVIGQIAEAPITAFEAGTVAAEPSYEAGLEFIKEHPYFSAAAITTALAAAGYSAVMISRLIPRVKKPEDVIPAAIPSPPPEEQIIKEKPVGITEEIPIVPEVTTITTGRKPYKRRRAKITPSVRQSVRVNIINRPTATGLRITNKRYLNHRLVA